MRFRLSIEKAVRIAQTAFYTMFPSIVAGVRSTAVPAPPPMLCHSPGARYSAPGIAHM